jgi:hypothetical protein
MEVGVTDVQNSISSVRPCYIWLRKGSGEIPVTCKSWINLCSEMLTHLEFSVCCISSVFALLPVHLGTLLTGKFLRIWEFFSLPKRQISNWEIPLKASWCVQPLVGQLGGYLRWQSVDPGPLKQGDRDRHLVLATSARRPCWHIESCQPALFVYPERLFPCFFHSCKANARVYHAKTGHGQHYSHVRRINCTGISPTLTSNMPILGSNPIKPSSQSYAPS